MQAHAWPRLANDPADILGRISRQSIMLAFAAALAVLCGAKAANAEVRVSGTADAIVVWTKGATLKDVVAGLESASHVRIALKGTTARQFTGTYSGPLREVLSRLLAGVDHITSTAADRITIIIVGPNAAHLAATAPDDGPAATVQGWVPERSQIALAAASAPAADDATEKASSVQGWVPTTVVASNTAAPQTPAAAPTEADEGTPGVQGWMPTSIAGPAQPAPVAAATPSGAPQGLDDGAASSVQGWVPTTARAN